MKKYNNQYLKKNLILCLGLYLVIGGLFTVDGITAKATAYEILARALVFLPFLLLCLLFIFLAYKGFERSVKKEEKKHSVTFTDEGERLLDKKHLVYYNDEWLIFAGREAIHFGSIAEITDPFGGTDLKVVGSKYRIVVMTDRKKRHVIGCNDPVALSSLKTAYLNYKQSV